MLTLNDGRSELWQWDTGRKLTVDADCSQVHFSNKVFGRSIDVDVVDGVAIIPDILLQTDKELTAWAFVGTAENGYTKISMVFKVNRRNKPADYVFTPPEQTTLDELVERLEKIEESQDPDAIKNAVEDYLQNNPIHVDEKDPTVPDWAKQPEKPKYTATEVGALPSTTNIPSKTSELINDSGFVNSVVANLVNYYLKSETYSRDEVKQLISAIPKFSIKPVSKLPTTDISETTIYLVPGGDGDDLYTEYIRVSSKWEILGSQKMDLTGYATETYVKDYAQPKGNYLTEVPKGYATEQFVKEQIAEAELGGEEVDLSVYALKSELPTKTSQLENDSGYLNAVPEGYAKTEDIPTKPEDIGAQPEGDYALRSEIPSVPVKSVNGKTGAVSLTATDVKARPDSWMPTASDVGALPSSTVIPTVPTKVSAFTNDAGYLTEHQDLSEYAKKTEIPSVPVKSVNGKTGAVQLSAADVKARPENWMPTAQEVGALPNTYTPPNQTAEQIGADPKGTAATAVSQHNTADDSHNDIRLELKAINDRLTAFFDSDNQTLDELSEIVAYITSNKSLIDSITTSKVSVADIINNLTSNVTNKPLSAAQGVVLKGLIDTLSGNLANYQPKGDYALRSEIPTVPTKISQFQNDAGYIKDYTETDPTVPAWAKQSTKPSYSKSEVGLGNVDNVKQYSASNPPPYPVTSVNGQTGDVQVSSKFDPTVYRLPILRLTGDTTGMTKETEVTLSYECNDKNGTAKTGSCTMKWQGSSSLAWDKKNYTIKFDNAFEVVDGWGSQKKYCLKANWIDHSHSRNVVSAKLWGLIRKNRSNLNSKLKALPNAGAIDGFPVIIMLNDEFHGLYSFNIPKDAWMFGMGSGTKEAIVGADNQADDTAFKAETLLDANGWELEYNSSSFAADAVKTSLNNLIKACIDSWGGDLDTTVAQYLDWESAIDYYIFAVILQGGDMITKNTILATFDGVKWYFSAYDMDTTYGLEFDGSGLVRAVTTSHTTFETIAETHRVFELIKRFKTNELKARYNALRTNELSESRICNYFENYAWDISSPLLVEEVKRWPSVRGSSVNGIDQICRWVRQRLEVTDVWMDALPAQETPVEPEEPVEMVNQVPISTDTDGSIYNGTGYKDNARLSSSGGVSSSAQTGSVVTGFIPWQSKGVIRMKGATYQYDSGKHYYIHFYDASKKFIYGGDDDSFLYGSSNAYSFVNFTYDEATGVTTIDFSAATTGSEIGSAAINAAYFRINAYGKGADLIITVNQEIT